jgi:GntR family transcriptional regulator
VRRDVQIRIDVSSPVPVYRQIVDGLRAFLVEGALRPGDALPSVRALAADLGIHFNTVAQAYRELAGEGWLDVSHGRAVRVVERRAPEGAGAEEVKQFRERLRHLLAEARARGVSLSAVLEEMKALMKGIQ